MSSYASAHLRQAKRLAGAFALVAAAATPAAAQVTFEEFATSAPVNYVQNCAVSGGLTFTAAGLGCDVTDAFAVYGPSQAAFYSGSAALFNNLTQSVIVTSASPFSLNSAMVTPGLGALGFDPTTVVFTGMLNGGGTISQTVTIAAGMVSPTMVNFSGFTNLTSFTYTVSSPSYDGVQIDNLAIGAGVAVVPEPSTVLLLGTGLAGVAVFARRRRRQ